MGRWRDPDAHTHRLGHRKAIMEIGRYEPVKGDRLGSGRPGVAAAAMETDRYGPVKAQHHDRWPTQRRAAMETDRYGPVKA